MVAPSRGSNDQFAHRDHGALTACGPGAVATSAAAAGARAERRSASGNETATEAVDCVAEVGVSGSRWALDYSDAQALAQRGERLRV